MPTTTINLTGQALSKTDDTNVTLTLGGTPLTALLKATTITVGWTGTLADSRIASAATWNAKESALTFGTGLTRSVNTVTIDSTVVTLTGSQALSNKTGLISQWTNDSGYLTSLSGAVTSVTGSGNIASSGGATPNITFTGVLPTANGGTGVNIATAALTLGTASSNAGSIVFQNATNANTVTVQSGVTSASYSLTLPTAQGGASTVLTNNGSGVLSWASASSGITVGTTTITSGTTLRIPYNLAGVYQEQANFTIGSVGIGLLDVPVGYAIAGARAFFFPNSTSVVIGNNITALASSGSQNVGLGDRVFGANTLTGGENVAIGKVAGYALTSGSYNVFIGRETGATVTTSSYLTLLGRGADAPATGTVGSIAIGYNAIVTASNQGVLGGIDTTNGVISNWYFNGVTSATPSATVLNGAGGSGTNIAGASVTIAGGKATGNAAAGYIAFQTSTVGSSGSTLQTNAERFRISTARVAASVPIGFKAYTVATLPAGTVGDTAYVTDATAPTYLGALVGGGAVACLVFYNGAAWVSC